VFVQVAQQPRLAFTVRINIRLDLFGGVLAGELGQEGALQQGHFGRGIPGGHSSGEPCLDHQYLLSGARQQQGGDQAGQPGPCHHGVVLAVGLKRIRSERFAAVQPNRRHELNLPPVINPLVGGQFVMGLLYTLTYPWRT
jgi:hypothetical protein